MTYKLLTIAVIAVAVVLWTGCPPNTNPPELPILTSLSNDAPGFGWRLVPASSSGAFTVLPLMVPQNGLQLELQANYAAFLRVTADDGTGSRPALPNVTNLPPTNPPTGSYRVRNINTTATYVHFSITVLLPKAFPTPGHIVIYGVGQDGTSSPPLDITLAARDYTITVQANGPSGIVTSNPTGIVCSPPATCSHNFNVAPGLPIPVVLTAQGDTQSDFNGWSGDCNTNSGNPCVLDLTGESPKTVTAVFKAAQSAACPLPPEQSDDGLHLNSGTLICVDTSNGTTDKNATCSDTSHAFVCCKTCGAGVSNCIPQGGCQDGNFSFLVSCSVGQPRPVDAPLGCYQ